MATAQHDQVAIAATARGSDKLVGIQYLRGLATLIVVNYHLTNQMDRLGYTGWWPPKLAGVIDVFFVISGFIMVVVTHARPIHPARFLVRRLLRLVPLYWLLTSVMLAMLLVAPGLLKSSRLDGWHVVASYLFVPTLYPGKPEMAPLLMPGWTLNYEVFFYTVFALFLVLPRRIALPALSASFVALYLIGAALGFAPLSIMGFYASGIALDVALGVAIGALVTQTRLLDRLPFRVAVALTIAGGLGILSSRGVAGSQLLSIVAAGGILLGMLGVEAHGRLPRLPLLEAIGTASYSIYLLHTMVLAAWMQLWVKASLGTGNASLLVFAAIAMVLSVATGWLCYLWAEQPLLHLFRPRQRGARIVVDPSPAEPVARSAAVPGVS